MVSFIAVISDPETKKARQIEIKEPKTSVLIGKKIGDIIYGPDIGLPESRLEITGGTDKDGFPMRRDVEGPVKKRILLSGPPGFHHKFKVQMKRKTIRGNQITEDTRQINLKIKEKIDVKGIERFFAKSKPKEEKK